MTRTAQEILAERRSFVQEQRRETDKTARAVLQYQIDELDRELNARREAIEAQGRPYIADHGWYGPGPAKSGAS